MHLMALDYGSKTVGIAVNDELGLTAIPMETVFRKHENKLRRTLAKIEEIAIQRKTERIILGKPLNMDMSEGKRVKKTEVFKILLEKRLGLEVVYVDERLTSVEARELLLESGIKPGDIKKYIDSVAAALILKEYMNGQSDEGKKDGKQ